MDDALQQRIDRLTRQQEQLKARKRQLLARASQQERKARTRRLIQIGAVMEKGLGMELDEQGRSLLLEELTTVKHGNDGETTTLGAQITSRLQARGYDPGTREAGKETKTGTQPSTDEDLKS
jgi:hypothetical protein